MKILLIGKTGQLGSDLLKNNSKHQMTAPDRGSLDIGDSRAVRLALEQAGPDVVINTAAYHDVGRCEKEAGEAMRINCLAVGNLALACRDRGALFLTFSSDYVFNGEKPTPYLEEDPVSPVQVYGMSRAAGEAAALSMAPRHSVVIRTCGLYGAAGSRARGGNFVDKRVRDGRTLKSIEMSSEQIATPTSTEDLSLAVLKLLDAPPPEPGIYHLVNEGSCSWFEFTAAIFSSLGLGAELIPVDRKGMENGMRRPIHSVLSNTRARRKGIVLPPWQDALKRYLQVKYPSGA